MATETDAPDIVIPTILDILIVDLDVAVDRARFDPSASLAEDLGVDSIGFLELRYQCEERFAITIDDGEFTPANFRTCAALANFVTSRTAAR